MATRTYDVGTGYKFIAGNLFQNNDLVVNGNGSNANIVIESTSIFNLNIPTTLFGTVNGSRAFDATLINKGVTFAGTSGSEGFDASKYLGDVKFNGGGGTNNLKGAAGRNVFTHDYANGGTDIIKGGQDRTVEWKILFLKYKKTYEASNDLVINGTSGKDLFRFDGTAADFKVFRDEDASKPAAIEASQFTKSTIVVNGNGESDYADVRAFGGVITFNGNDGDDKLSFEHGVSGAGTVFNGGDGVDKLHVEAHSGAGQKSNLRLVNNEVASDNGLFDVTNQKVLVDLDSVEILKLDGEGTNGFDIDVAYADYTRLIAKGSDYDDSVTFQHGFSVAGAVFKDKSTSDNDTLYVHSKVGGTSNLKLVNDEAASDNGLFDVDASQVLVDLKNIEVLQVNGQFTNDTNFNVDVTYADYTRLVANGSVNNDTVRFQHGFSVAGAAFQDDSTSDTDTLFAHSKAGGTSNLKLVNDEAASDNGLFDVDASQVLVDLKNIEVLQVEGQFRTDTSFNVDVTYADYTRLVANGGVNNDTVRFQHGFSVEGAVFNDASTADSDTLYVHGNTHSSAGSNLKLGSNGQLVDQSSSNVQVYLTNVENVDFLGNDRAETFDATGFTGKVFLDGGAGDDVLKAGVGGSVITGGVGADVIHLGSGVDKVIYTTAGDSTLAQLDKVSFFNQNQDKLVFELGNAVQEYKGFVIGNIIGGAAFDNGVLEFSGLLGIAAEIAFNVLSLQDAASLVALAADDNSIAAFKHHSNWYVIEAGNGTDIDNLVHLVGSNTLSNSSNLHNFVEFA